MGITTPSHGEICLSKLSMRSGSIRAFDTGCPVILPEAGHALAPWCSIKFVVGGNEITVGNHSSPDSDNKAVIKSMEYSHRDGFSLRVLIEDQEGGSLIKVVDHMLKKWHKSDEQIYELKFQFGWTRNDCDKPLQHAVSDCYLSILQNCETSFSQGKFFIELMCSDLLKLATQGGVEKICGEDGKGKICLRDAITEIMTNEKYGKPKIESVFIARRAGKELVPCEFYEKEEGHTYLEGPFDKWDPEGKDKLNAVKTWLTHHRSRNNKGWILNWDEDTTTGGKRLLILEDPMPNCNEPIESDCIGTFLVNAGKYSPVLEFNPRFQWTFWNLTGAGQGTIDTFKISPMKDDKGDPTVKSKGNYFCEPLNRYKQPGVGKHTQHHPDSASQNRQGDGAAEEDAKSQDRQARADRRLEPLSGIDAVLTIVGDPTLVRPDEQFTKTAKIIHFNPFYITPGQNGNRLEWLATPVINAVVTNSEWFVNGVTHRISEGKYTTSLDLVIGQPGVDIDPEAPLGGAPDGYKPQY